MTNILSVNVSCTDIDLFKHLLRILQQSYELTNCQVTKQYIRDELMKVLGKEYDIDRLLTNNIHIHKWIEVTTIGAPKREFMCNCGAKKEEDYDTIEKITKDLKDKGIY